MKKNSKILTLGAIAFLLVLSINNYASSKVPANFNVAVVDVPKIVASSSQVNALKLEQKAKVEELTSFITSANSEIKKETNETKKKDLEAKYKKELMIKKEAIEKEYAKKLAAVDSAITATIKKKATEANYDLVLSKSVVLVGGADITEEISKLLK